MLDLVVIDAVNDSSSRCVNIAFSAFSHIANDLQLGRRGLLQLRAVESYLKDVGELTSFDEGIRAKFILLPFMHKCLETEVAEHAHMSSIHYLLQERKHNTLALRKSLMGVAR